ncbi:LysM peptidoglycan-binding domain-containing protein [Listeria welshimeri]|nr:LysM peptidoglycan-binding domain-containing protein [Listeria welshimeri]MBC1432625.1 LysM peptidoglycan-binding domain-containing protein [Listeria welshimeri]MBC1588358.1 LysM peptidoglycan-binding domain-containing protein [Listeria welshimeri]
MVKGDSLWAISRQYKTTVDNIKASNKLTSNMIHVGQKLRIKREIALSAVFY